MHHHPANMSYLWGKTKGIVDLQAPCKRPSKTDGLKVYSQNWANFFSNDLMFRMGAGGLVAPSERRWAIFWPLFIHVVELEGNKVLFGTGGSSNTRTLATVSLRFAVLHGV